MPNPAHEEAAVLEKRRATIKHQIDQRWSFLLRLRKFKVQSAHFEL